MLGTFTVSAGEGSTTPVSSLDQACTCELHDALDEACAGRARARLRGNTDRPGTRATTRTCGIGWPTRAGRGATTWQRHGSGTAAAWTASRGRRASEESRGCVRSSVRGGKAAATRRATERALRRALLDPPSSAGNARAELGRSPEDGSGESHCGREEDLKEARVRTRRWRERGEEEEAVRRRSGGGAEAQPAARVRTSGLRRHQSGQGTYSSSSQKVMNKSD